LRGTPGCANVDRMNPDSAKLARHLEEIAHLDSATALEYANAIGDTPEIDAEGKTVIRDFRTGKVIDRVSIPGFLIDFPGRVPRG